MKFFINGIFTFVYISLSHFGFNYFTKDNKPIELIALWFFNRNLNRNFLLKWFLMKFLLVLLLILY